MLLQSNLSTSYLVILVAGGGGGVESGGRGFGQSALLKLCSGVRGIGAAVLLLPRGGAGIEKTN